ncbi:nitrilase family protein [Bacteroidia bacterium]|jgi:predicted amidohydrolase|nr:nitrilase family protein [Bacteroidia bacterium]
MTALQLNLIQTDLTWENVNQNLLRFQWHIERTPEQSLVVLPEMFATGFTMNPSHHAEKSNGLVVQWLKEMSKNKCICGSLSFEEEGKYYNRFLAVANGKIICEYDKVHLFSLGEENKHYQRGKRTTYFEWNDWKIAPFICYDLRFPELMREQANADLMLFLANWPKMRMTAWNSLLRARAIENQCMVAGVNRVGKDGNGFPHSGCTQIIDYAGTYLVEPVVDREVSVDQTIEKTPMYRFREKFPFLKDKK